MSKILVLLAVLFIISSISMLSAELKHLRIGWQTGKTLDTVATRYKTHNREPTACIVCVTNIIVDLYIRLSIDIVSLQITQQTGQFHVYVDLSGRLIDVKALVESNL
jgi:membrane glycosyltransferase